MASADWAEAMARELLEEALPRRWAHTQGVAATARTLSGILGDDTDLIVAAAWLHGIGYSPAIAVTGFHPLDGARHLRDMEQASALLCCLVAHHSCAMNEAAERGLAGELAREFPPPPDDLADALTYCDMTTGPDGQDMIVEARRRNPRPVRPGPLGQPGHHRFDTAAHRSGLPNHSQVRQPTEPSKPASPLTLITSR